MVRALLFLLILLIRTWSLDPNSVPLKCHEMVSGESPLIIEHCVDTKSPAFMGSSPKENDMIWGSTVERVRENYKLGNNAECWTVCVKEVFGRVCSLNI